MQIKEDAFVAIEYRLTDDQGAVLDESEQEQALPFIFGAEMIVPGVEKALKGKEVGFSTRVTVEPDDGYGPINKDLLQTIPRSSFPEEMEIKEGMIFQASTPHGPTNFMVSSVTDTEITADFNHPLAGKRLHFDLKVTEVREATEEDKNALGCGPDCGHGHGGCSGCGHDHH